jgi:hypothetical protein
MAQGEHVGWSGQAAAISKRHTTNYPSILIADEEA